MSVTSNLIDFHEWEPVALMTKVYLARVKLNRRSSENRNAEMKIGCSHVEVFVVVSKETSTQRKKIMIFTFFFPGKGQVIDLSQERKKVVRDVDPPKIHRISNF